MANPPRWPTPDEFDHLEWGAGVNLAVSAGAVSITSALTVGGLYLITTDHDVHHLQGNFTSGASSQVQASTTDIPMWSKSSRNVWVYSSTAGGNNDIGADAVSFRSRTGASGTIWYARVK
mgnify:FL=1